MALTYIKETHRTEGVLLEIAVCPECFEDVAPEVQTAHDFNRQGYKVEVREWRGEDRECSYCPTRHLAGENFHTEPDDQHDAEDGR